MLPTPASTPVEAWFQWFATQKQTTCRAYLCTRYHLDALDAAALINAARLQVFLHWDNLQNPLAYFWQTLKHATTTQAQRRIHERRQLQGYARQSQVHTHFTARMAQQVTDLLERVSPRQQQLLKWFLQGERDAQVAAWLGSTPQAVRVARHSAYCALRAQLSPAKDDDRHHSRFWGEHDFFWYGLTFVPFQSSLEVTTERGRLM